MVIIEHICKEKKKKRNKNKKKRKEKWNRYSLKAVWNFTTRPRHPSCCISEKNKSPQKLFHWQTILLHHVSHYHGVAFGCYKNPYLNLFNLYCGFTLIEALISRYWLSEAPCCTKGIGAEAQRKHISTLGFEMIKRVSYLSHEWEVRGWMVSEMHTHSHLNTAWDVENERQRGTWMKEEASHRGVGWNRVGDMGEGRKTESVGKCFTR